MKKEINRLMKIDIDDLYLEIGLSINHSTLEIDNTDIRKLIETGKECAEQTIRKVKKTICFNDNFKQLYDSGIYEDKINFIAQLADIISSVKGGIPTFAISVLIVKIGLNEICK